MNKLLKLLDLTRAVQIAEYGHTAERKAGQYEQHYHAYLEHNAHRRNLIIAVRQQILIDNYDRQTLHKVAQRRGYAHAANLLDLLRVYAAIGQLYRQAAALLFEHEQKVYYAAQIAYDSRDSRAECAHAAYRYQYRIKYYVHNRAEYRAYHGLIRHALTAHEV